MKLKVGDKVAYSVQFLHSIGMLTGDMPAGRGVVESLQKLGQRTLVTVKWDRDLPPKVIDANLAKVGANRRFCKCD